MSHLKHRAGRLAWLIALVAMLAAAALPAAAQAKPGKHDLRVMTQNLYLGADLNPAIAAETPTEFLVAVATIYGKVQFTDFPVRAQAIAGQVKASNPDVIGLQEVSKWTVAGPPGAPPSLDFLTILQSALTAKGLSYSVASTSNNANIGPAPLVAGGSCSPLPGPPFATCSVQLEDRDVILVRDDSDVVVTGAANGNFTTQLVVPTPIGSLSFNRGWASIDATLANKSFRLVNSHLETEAAPPIQVAEGNELLAGPLNVSGNLIVLGDFNSAADGSTTTTYANLIGSGLSDTWVEANGSAPGYSCCHDDLLINPSPSLLNERIDLVLTKKLPKSKDASLVGAAGPFQGVPPLWPSDHAGVVAEVKVN